MPFIAVVRLLIDADTEAEACDDLTSLLCEQMRSAVPTSSLLDWQYELSGAPASVDVEWGYCPDVSTLPEHPRVYTAEK